ncbi:MAG: serine/threonine-protein kinase, partial [Planctomycetota bacterium]
MESSTAEEIGGYRLTATLGEGGFGTVYKAEDPSGAIYALKQLHEAGADPDELAYEFRVLSRVNHPHIVPVTDFGFSGERPYLVSQWIDGQSLREYAREHSREEILQTLGGVLRALEYLHARGLLHRDLKPQNVVVNADGHAFLIDFGLAGLTGQDAGRSGTPAYVAPERLLGRPEDGRSDLFSFGVLLHELLTGELPGDRSVSATGRLEPEALSRLVKRLQSSNPARRPRTANTVIAKLSRATGIEIAEERGIDPAHATTDPAQTALPRTLGLVGRERELSRFRKLLRAPRHRVLLVPGAAGCGKSHLLRAFGAEALVGRARVIAGRSLAELEREGSSRGDKAATDSIQQTAVDPADRLLADALGRRTVVLIDDVHRLLPTEVQALVDLATRLDSLPHPERERGLLVVLAYRPGELAPYDLDVLVDRLTALARSRTLKLGPLIEAAVPRLVTEILGRTELPSELAAELHQQAEGRPAALIDLLRHLRAERFLTFKRGAWRRSGGPITWPPSPGEVLRREARELPEADLAVLHWIAAAGLVDTAMLRGLAPNTDPTQLRALEQQGWIVRLMRPGGGPAVALANDRVGPALPPDDQAAERHRKLAEVRRGRDRCWIEHAARATGRKITREALAHALERVSSTPVLARSLLTSLCDGPGLPKLDRARAAIG